MRIAVSNPDSMGDLLLREPLFSELLAVHHELLLLVQPFNVSVARRLAPNARIVPIPVDPYRTSPYSAMDRAAIYRTAQLIRDADIDMLVIAPTQRVQFDELLIELLPALAVRALDGGRYPAAVGAAQSRVFLPSGAWPKVNPEWSEAERNHRLCEHILGHELPWRAARLTATSEELEAGARLVERIAPGTRNFWVACVGDSERNHYRNWPIEKWTAVLRHAVEKYSSTILLIGSVAERPVNAQIAASLQSLGSVFDATGQSDDFADLLGLVALSRGYIGRDTGPMHLAALLEIPVFAIFGGGTWPRFLPVAHGQAIGLDVPCRGCGWVCHFDRCYCIKEVPMDSVYEAMDRFMTNADTPLQMSLTTRTPQLAEHMEREAGALARDRMWLLAQTPASVNIDDAVTLHAPRPLQGNRWHVHIGMSCYGAGNVGDDLMLAGFLHAVRQDLPELRLTACSPFDPAPSRRRFTDIEWHPYDDATRSELTRTADIWLGLGDTPFQSDTGPWMIQHLVQELAFCRQHRVPMYFLGCGLNNRSVLDDPRLREVINHASQIWTRDTASARWLAQVAPPGRVKPGADLAHIFLQSIRPRPLQPGTIGWTLNFEDDKQLDAGALAEMITPETGSHLWMIQEVRELEGSEKVLWGILPEETRRRFRVCEPDYAGADTTEALLAAWPAPEVLVSSRYHALLFGAWSGARLVAIERNDKLVGAVESLGCRRLSSLHRVEDLRREISSSYPVDRYALNVMAFVARRSCQEFLRIVDMQTRSRSLASAAGEIVIDLPEWPAGEDWYEPEHDGTRWFRWMRGSRAAVVYPSPPLCDYTLVVDVAHVLGPEPLHAVSLGINGHQITCRVLDRADGKCLEATIPAAVVRAGCDTMRLEFFAPLALSPQSIDPGSSDSRMLAFALERIRLLPFPRSSEEGGDARN